MTTIADQSYIASGWEGWALVAAIALVVLICWAWHTASTARRDRASQPVIRERVERSRYHRDALAGRYGIEVRREADHVERSLRRVERIGRDGGAA